MVKSKKLLSLFLAVVMVLSVFTVMASAAYTRGEAEGSADIDIKYTVKKVGTVPETSAGSAEWSADNLYAVTVWMKSAKPVDTFIVPFHYNKAHFAPVTLSDGEATYPAGAGLDQDTYYTDMGEGAIYAYSLGDYMNNTGMYKANGTTATTKALAKCIGLGNSNSEGVSVTTELVSPDHPLYNKWGAGLSSTTGVAYTCVDVATKTKTAYLNTLEGVETYTDWVNMFTLYFETITDEDVIGDEFGVFTDDCFTIDGSYDGKGLGYFQGATAYESLVPSFNVVSNAVVTPVYNKTSQIRYTGAVSGDYAPFDIRSRAALSATDFAAICGDDAAAESAITAVGFVFKNGDEAFDMAAAKAAVAAKATQGSYVYVECTEIVKNATDGDYFWSCLVTGAEYTGSMYAMGFITVGDKTYFVDAAQYTDFSVLYDTYADKIPA